MPIPGVKVLDEILLGMPVNALQRAEIAELKEQIATLQQENENLKREKALNAPKPDMAVDAVKILQCLFVNDRGFSAEDIADAFELEIGMAKYHCDVLREKRLIGFRNGPLINRNRSIEFEISPAGRTYLVEKGLVPESS